MATNILDQYDPIKLGRSLQRARKRIGITQEEAGKQVDLARTTMVAIENGDRRIKAAELLKLSRVYGCQVSDFLNDGPEIEEFNVQFRGPSSPNEDQQKEIQPFIHEFEDLCFKYLELEKLRNSPMHRRYPSQYSINSSNVEQIAEHMAMDERARLNLGDGAIPPLRAILEQDVGFRIFYLKLPGKFSEMYYCTDELGACMAINSNHPEERRRWSLAHGYAHFLTSRYSAIAVQTGKYQRMPLSERFADAFSRYFLMPTSGVTRRYNDLSRDKEVTLGDFVTLAHYYWVSLEALVRRLEDLKLVMSGTADKIIEGHFRVNDAKKQLGLAPKDVNAHRLPLRYQWLALEALQAEEIGEGQFARYLGLDRLEAREVASNLITQNVPLHSTEEIVMTTPPETVPQVP